jgi:DNA-binding transcriptional LysR family regulator
VDAHRLNIRHLAAMAAVIRTGSVSAAARAVNLTQPAVTQGIAKLEREFGFPLFKRSPAGLAPTDEARLLGERAEAALRLIGTRNATAAQIRAFVALAQAGSYAGAAAITGLAEASLHRAITDLSLIMDLKLVERRGRGVALTRRGLTVARDLRLALAELRAGIAEMDAVQGRETGRIAIGAMPLARARTLPDAVVAFHAASPHVDIAIVEGSHVELAGPLRDGEIDMMVGALRDLPAGGDLVEMPLFEDRPAVIARPGHPLASEREVTVARLAEFPWIVAGEGAPLRTLWRRLFEEEGITPPRVPIECGAAITIRQLLMAGDFLALISVDQLAIEIEIGRLVRIIDAPAHIYRTIGVTTRADWRPTPQQARFIDILVAQAAANAS